ncbi:MAG: peptide-methionine (S)-S-oxide reductase MsrA [Bacteroidetes bacterium]|nr:peptide-methionine (S)-S-oxide reductase MsrA [Bacteroidota bacterium]
MKKNIIRATVWIAVAFFMSTGAKAQKTNIKMNTSPHHTDTATFGAGCFWCVEAVFQNLKGVEKVISGYSGGAVKNPAYREVCTGLTGHAEVCQIIYNPQQVSFKDLLEVFWQTHNPTTLNQQGNDKGTQYRSVVFFHNETQKQLAETYKRSLDQSGAFNQPIVTTIEAYKNFYPAEDYHQNYYNQNGEEPYCQYVIKPKMEKFKKAFHSKLK